MTTAVLPVDRAMLCPDCDVLVPRAYRVCPACGRDQLVPLAAWLGTTTSRPSGRYPQPHGIARKGR